MDIKPQQSEQTQESDKPDQPYQFHNSNSHFESSQKSVLKANQDSSGHPINEPFEALSSSQVNVPAQIYDMPKENNLPHLGSEQPKQLLNEEKDVPFMPSQGDQDDNGSPGTLHSIFFGQLLQTKIENRTDQLESEQMSQFQHQFANMDLKGVQNPPTSGNVHHEKDMGPRPQIYHGFTNPQIQNEAQQYLTPNKMNVNSQMYQQQAIMTQKSEIIPPHTNMAGPQYFNQGMKKDMVSYPTDDNDLRCGQQYNLLQNAQNQIYKKNSQIEKLNSNQRKMSDNHYENVHSIENNQNVYLDENVNKLVDLQEPSESNSTFNQTNFHAQINDILNEDDDDSHAVDPSLYQQSNNTSNINQQLDQFEDITISPQFEGRTQYQKQIPQYNDQGVMFNNRSGKNESQPINQYQTPQMNHHNLSKTQLECINEQSKMSGYINNNQSNLNLNQFENSRIASQQVFNMQQQQNIGNRPANDLKSVQYENNLMMQQQVNQRNQQSQLMMDEMIMPPGQIMNQQQIGMMQQQMSAGHIQEPKLLIDQNQTAQLTQNTTRSQNAQYPQMTPQHQNKMQNQFSNQFQEHDSEFLSKVTQKYEQSKNQKIQLGDSDQQNFDFNSLGAQAHEIINQNKQISQQMQMGVQQQQMYEGYRFDPSMEQQPKYSKNNQNQIGPEQQKISNEMQRMVQNDDYKNLTHMMQQQLLHNQKQSQHFNSLLGGNSQANKQNGKSQSPEMSEQMNMNPGFNSQQQNQFIYQPATIDPNFTAMYQTGNQNQAQIQSQYLYQKQQQIMNPQQINQPELYSQQIRPNLISNNAYAGNMEGQQNCQEINQSLQAYEYRPGVHPSQINVDENQMQKRKVPSRRQAYSEKEGYPQTQNFIEDEQIDNLNIPLSSTRKESRIQQSSQSSQPSKIQVQTKGRTRRTGSSYVYRDKPIEMIPVDVQDIDIDIDNDLNQDQSSQGMSKNGNKSKSFSSGGSKQAKENSQMRYKKAKNKSSNNNDNDESTAALIETDSGSKPNFSNEQQSFSDSRGLGRGSRGGNSNSSKSGHHSLAGTNSHTSNQSYDEFIQQIQHDVKKANKDPEKEFIVLNGHIIRLATKKVGSKFLQEHLGQANQSLINKIIDQIDGYLPDLMTDNYGNYFCSELIKYLQVHQRIHFMKQIKGNKFIEISCNNRGTYTLQNIIYAVTQPQEFEIIKETLLENNNICYLAKDKEGHHMLEKIITTFNEKERYYIFQEIMDKFNELATDKNGLCVLKKLIQHTKDESCQKQVISKILENGLEYVQNAFGNFVVSEVLNQFSFQICKEIFFSMKSHFVRLSQNKFSSKFIEVCIDKAPIKIQDEVILEFCESPYLHRVVQSQFGNFVLQNSIAQYCKTEEQRNDLIHSVILSLQEVTDYKVQVKWGQEILMKFIQKVQNESEYHRLNDMIKTEMNVISQKHQVFKQQQHIQMQRNVEVYSNNSQSKAQGRKSAGNSNQPNSYPGAHFQVNQYSQRGPVGQQDIDYFQVNQPNNWNNNNFKMNMPPNYDPNQEGQGHYSKQYNQGKYQKNNNNQQYGSQKGKYQKNKKTPNTSQQMGGQFQNKTYFNKNQNSNDQVSSNYNKQQQQYQGKPLTLKRNNIQYANQNSEYTNKQEPQFGDNEQFCASARQIRQMQAMDNQNQDDVVNNPNFNQAAQSSRNSGIRTNSIFTDDPTGLNQSSSGGTSEKANKVQNSQAKPHD